ncbi:MAG: tRNA dihydrouridine synthase DusB [Clostridia bacterium]
MKIGNHTTTSNVFLAPMAGVSDAGFRAVCTDFGAGLTFCEMISAEGLLRAPNVTQKLLKTTEFEQIKCAQLFGNVPEKFVEAIKSQQLEKFDIIDLNFGCPAPKIVKNKQGSFVLQNPKLVSEIINKCVKSTNKLITAKIRLGYEKNNVLEIAKICEESGVSMLTVHGRTKTQMFGGEVDYDSIAKVKACLKIPVVGNGNIINESSYKKMLLTGVDAVMIGRGACGNPWIFSQIQNITYQKNVKQTIKKHFEILLKNNNEQNVVMEFRKHLLWYAKGQSSANKMQIQQVLTKFDVENVINNFFD